MKISKLWNNRLLGISSALLLVATAASKIFGDAGGDIAQGLEMIEWPALATALAASIRLLRHPERT